MDAHITGENTLHENYICFNGGEGGKHLGAIGDTVHANVANDSTSEASALHCATEPVLSWHHPPVDNLSKSLTPIIVA